MWRPAPFAEHLNKLKIIVEQQPHCLVPALQVIASVGRISKEKAKNSLDYIITQLPKVESNYLANGK